MILISIHLILHSRRKNLVGLSQVSYVANFPVESRHSRIEPISYPMREWLSLFDVFSSKSKNSDFFISFKIQFTDDEFANGSKWTYCFFCNFPGWLMLLVDNQVSLDFDIEWLVRTELGRPGEFLADILDLSICLTHLHTVAFNARDINKECSKNHLKLHKKISKRKNSDFADTLSAKKRWLRWSER